MNLYDYVKRNENDISHGILEHVLAVKYKSYDMIYNYNRPKISPSWTLCDWGTRPSAFNVGDWISIKDIEVVECIDPSLATD